MLRPAAIEEDRTIREGPRIREQRQREAEEHARMLRKERLMREIDLGALNARRYRALWREMMMRIKMPRIVEDVEVAWRNFERALDIKDYRISFLMDELAEAEEQYQRSARSNAETIDRLLRTYAERMEREESSYRGVLNDTLDRMNDEIGEIHHRQNEDESLLHSITRGVQLQLEESLNNVKSVALSRIDALVEEGNDIRRISAAQLENRLKGCWEDMQRVLSNYQNRTEDRRKYYEALREKDEMDRQVIAQQLSRVMYLFEEIRRFRSKIAAYDATADKDISEILNEHEFFQKVYKAIKHRFLSDQTKDKDQLKILSIEYAKTMKHLERLVTKGKRVLTLMEICGKYESHDKIKAFPVIECKRPEDLPSDDLPLSQRASGCPEWDLSRQILEDFEDLTWFWQRVGSERVSTAQLRSERDRLKVEADQLRECLKDYMTRKKVRGEEKCGSIAYKII